MFTNEYDEIVDYKLEVARGNVIDATTIHKFGLAEEIDVADGVVDIWDGVSSDIGGKVNPYNWIDTPIALQISSASTSDTAVTMKIQGLDENGLDKEQEIILEGNDPVQLEGLWTAVNRGYNSSSTDLVGNVFVSDGGTPLVDGRPTDNLTIRAIIHLDYQQTQQAVYTVPSDTTLYITQGWAHISKSTTTEANLSIYRASPGGVFRALHTFALQTSGSSGDQRPYSVPLRLEAGSRIIYRAQVFSNGTAISAGFHGILIKE